MNSTLKPWLATQQSYEAILKELLSFENPSQDAKEFGDCLIVNIVLCQQVEATPAKLQIALWDKVSTDLQDTLVDCQNLMQEFALNQK